jgi:hypothetical protein
MKNIIFYTLVILFLASCSSGRTVNTTYNKNGSTEKTISQKGLFGQKDVLRLKEEWEFETLIETGEAPVLSKYKEETRNKLLARKGAILEAQRKLAEKVGTIRLNATTTMVDFATNDLVQSRLNVYLKEVTVLSEDYDKENKLYKVSISMPKLKVINVLEEYINN